MMKFLHDPYKLLIKVVYAEFPEKKKEFDSIIIQWMPQLAKRNKCYGAAYFDIDKKPTRIDLDADLTVVQAVEVFIHELAHVVVGCSHNHDRTFKKMCKFIQEKYHEEVKKQAKRKGARVVSMKKR
jgi:hypothetical protein